MNVYKLLVRSLRLPLSCYAATTGLQIKTKLGIVEGKEAGPVRAFLGIPYAAPTCR